MNRLEFSLKELLKEEVVLTKVDVARRQLDTSIKMFFTDEDSVSTHTVASAAYEVIRGLCHHKDIKISIKDSPLIEESARGAYIKAVNMPQNFFKHSDKDPKERIAFKYQGTSIYILDAIIQYVSLGLELTYRMKVFLVWARLMFPGLLANLKGEEEIEQIRGTNSNPETFKLLAKVLLNDEKISNA